MSAYEPTRMRADAAAVGRHLRLEQALRDARSSGTTARRVKLDAPSIRYEDYPREVRKRDVDVSDAAARIANALHLHLD
jgi:hypothetical protein